MYFTQEPSSIDEDASVTVTILDMNALALKMFFNSLNCHASKLLEKVRNMCLLYDTVTGVVFFAVRSFF